MKRWIAIGLIVLVLGGIIVYNKVLHSGPGEPGGKKEGASGGSGGSAAKGPSGPAAVNGFVVVAQELKDEVVASGSLIASEQVDVYPEISGRIVKLG